MIYKLGEHVSRLFFFFLFWWRMAWWFSRIPTPWKLALKGRKWSEGVSHDLARHYLYSYESSKGDFHLSASNLASAIQLDPAIAHKVSDFLDSCQGKPFLGTRVFRRFTISCLKLVLKNLGDNEKYGDVIQKHVVQLEGGGRTSNYLASEVTCSEKFKAEKKKSWKQWQAEENFLLAVSDGRLSDVRKTLDGGLDPDCRNESGATPLMTAVGQRQIEVTLLLLSRGVDVNAREDLGHTALHWAIGYGYSDLVKILLEKGADPNSRCGPYDTSPLKNAVSCGQIEIVQTLIDSGADLDAKDLFGETILGTAAAYGHQKVLKTLLEAGINPNQTDDQGHSALRAAVATGHRDCTRILISNGAKIDLPDKHGRTPLMNACGCGLKEVVTDLIEAGANVNARDEDGRTPLMIATFNGRTEIIRDLLENRADKNLRDIKGKASIDFAKDEEAKDLLLNHDGEK